MMSSAALQQDLGADPEIRGIFLTLIPPRIVEIEKMLNVAKAENSRPAMKRLNGVVHQIAGTAGTVGMVQIDAQSRSLEAAINDHLQNGPIDVAVTAELEARIEMLLDTLEDEFCA